MPEDWIKLHTVKAGYEISFNKHCYGHKRLRSLKDTTLVILVPGGHRAQWLGQLCASVSPV